jgi:hypothetical protein
MSVDKLVHLKVTLWANVKVLRMGKMLAIGLVKASYHHTHYKSLSTRYA